MTRHHTPLYRPVPTGICTRVDDHISLMFKEQVEGANVPSYGQHGLIKGDLVLSRAEEVVSVHIKLEGKLEITLGGIGKPSASTRFFSVKHTLWQASEITGSPPEHPSVLAFSMKLPVTIHGRDSRTYPLPPSCEMSFVNGDPLCSISCKYTITAAASKAPLFSILRRRKILTINIEYHPQSLPPTPLLPIHLSYLDTLRTVPAAWYEINLMMQTRHKSGVEPIQCHLYISSTQIYGLSTPIPFHLQLIAPPASLGSIYTNTTNIINANISSLVRVCLMRHLTAKSHGNKVRQVVLIGEGELHSLPPRSLEEDVLRWDGYVKCCDEVRVGAFSVEDVLSIKDYIVLTVCPPHIQRSPLLWISQHKHPIRLVGGSWSTSGDRA